jgi:3-hydroxyisobutyrate dehydrogenase
MIAMLGTGTMGAPMARNMAEAGLDLRVWNRTREKAEPLAGERIEVVSSAEEAVQGADVVITMLADGDSVASVM